MIPKLRDPAKHPPVSPASWKPSTDASVSPTTSNFTPAETPTKASSFNDPGLEDMNAASMEETADCTAAKQEGKTSDSQGLKSTEEASPLKPEGPSTSKDRNSTNPKAKKGMCKKHAKDAKRKAKRHSKTVETDTSSDSGDTSSDSSSSCSSDDSSESSSEEDEAAKKKRKSKARKAKKLKAKKRAKAKAKAEETDSDSDDESTSEEEDKKSKKKKQAKKKKRARKSKEVEEDDEEEEDDDDDDVNAAFNRQQLAQLQAMSLKRIGRGRVGRGNSGETVNVNGELGKKNAKAKGKPGKRLVIRILPSIKFQDQVPGSPYSFCPSQIRSRTFAPRWFRLLRRSLSKSVLWPDATTYHFFLRSS